MNERQHILSINLEDYFQVSPMRQVIPHRYWPRFDLRIEKSTLATLDLLDKTGATATFFTLGWLAEQCPDLIAEVSRRGHEVASKGYFHRPYAQMTLDEFRDDYLRSRDAIETATGKEVLGYRIAEGSLPIGDDAPFRALAQAGVRYDSSVRPFGTRFIGRPGQRRVHERGGEGWSIMEVPFSSDTLLGVPIPVTGGNYMRQMPQRFFENRVHAYLARRDEPWHFYFHTWELDSDQPRISAAKRLARIRQYRNLENMRERIGDLLDRLRFDSIASHLRLEASPAAVREKAPEAPKIVVRPAATGPRTRVTIVTPCFNEEETLPYLAGNLASVEEANANLHEFSYVFVDDGSKDRTWEKLNELFADKPNVQLIRHPQNRGIAAAMMTGIRASSDEIVCGIDCDCSYDPTQIRLLLDALGPNTAMVTASPYHRDGHVLNVPAWRLVLSRGLSMLYGLIVRQKLATYTSCLRVYRRSVAADIDLKNEGYLGIAEILVRLDRNGAEIVEVPATLESRLFGQSKMKVLRAIVGHIRLLASLAGERFHHRPI